MLEEYNALMSNNTLKLVPYLPNVNVLRSTWNFQHKQNGDGSSEQQKDRLVGG